VSAGCSAGVAPDGGDDGRADREVGRSRAPQQVSAATAGRPRRPSLQAMSTRKDSHHRAVVVAARRSLPPRSRRAVTAHLASVGRAAAATAATSAHTPARRHLGERERSWRWCVFTNPDTTAGCWRGPWLSCYLAPCSTLPASSFLPSDAWAHYACPAPWHLLRGARASSPRAVPAKKAAAAGRSALALLRVPSRGVWLARQR
jgi:hypothetical protein